MNIDQIQNSFNESDVYPPPLNDPELGSPECISDDKQYRYCYQTLIIELNEWYRTLKMILGHQQGKTAPKPAQAQAKGKKPAMGAKRNQENLQGESTDGKVRCFALKQTMNK